MHDLHINFVSSEGRAEAYNMLHRGSENEKFFADFISANPETGGHFQTRMTTSEDIIQDEDSEGVEGGKEGLEDEKDSGKVEKSTMHLLGRKNLSSGFYNHELISELEERGWLEDSTFGPKRDPEDEGQIVSYKTSVEKYMRKIEETRKDELYSHTREQCSQGCYQRGCGQVIYCLLFPVSHLLH